MVHFSKSGVLAMLLAAGCLGSIAWAESGVAAERADEALPSGLESFLRARKLESEGRLVRAEAAYESALQQAPEVREIRIAFASMLLNTGRPDRVVELLDGLDDLDWYGQRTLALALGQLATRKPEMLPRAREALEAATDLRGDDPNLQLTLTHVLASLGDTVGAERTLGELRDGLGPNPRVDSFHAQLLLDLGRPGEAAEAVEICSKPPFALDMCREIRMRALVDDGQTGEAGTLLAEWVQRDDVDGHLRAAALLMDGGLAVQALQVVRKVLAMDPKSPPARQMEAVLLVDLGEFETARPRLTELLKKNPENLDLILAMAWAEAEDGRGDLDRARSRLDQAWGVVSEEAGSPTAARVCFNGAQIEIAFDHPSAAREWLGRVADKGANAPRFIFILAETYRINGEWTAGAEALARLQPEVPEEFRAPALALEVEFRVRGGDEGALARLEPLLDSARLPDVGMAIQVLQGLERWEAAEAATERALERFPTDRSMLFARAVSLERVGRIDDAAAVFEDLLEQYPGDPEVSNYLGYLWADEGRNLHRALELIRTAVEAQPQNAAYLDSLGWVQYRLGRLEEAHRWLRRAVELGGASEGTVVGHLGEVLLEMGQPDVARPWLQRALELGCEDPERIRALLERIRAADTADE